MQILAVRASEQRTKLYSLSAAQLYRNFMLNSKHDLYSSKRDNLIKILTITNDNLSIEN